MVCTICENCGGTYQWDWTEAFSKFGFNDGQGQIETLRVAAVLEQAGYTVFVGGNQAHNSVVASIRKDRIEQIPFDNPDYHFGYDDPREFFPKEIIQLLDAEFPEE